MFMQKMAQTWRVRLALLGLLTADASSALADSWKLPERRTYKSENGAYVLVVSPKKLSSQLEYFEDKVEGREDSGGIPGLRGNTPSAELRRVTLSHRQRRIAKFALINEVGPASALVSDDGRWIVTFDNWHSVGLGDSVIVIYRSDGSLVRSLALEDVLLAEDLDELPRSVSSRQWSRGKRIDSSRARLVLQVSRCGWASNCVEEPGILEIDLNDGSLVGPKRQLVPHVVGRVSLSGSGPQEWLRVVPGTSCPASGEGANSTSHTFVTFDDVRPVASGLERPGYTKLAWKARIHGPVILDLDVAQDGSVECVEVVRSLPMGLAEAARSVTLGWRLRAGPMNVRTRIVFDFQRGEEQLPASDRQATP